MLYETFTGTLPFKSDSDDLVAVIFAHVNEPPPPPRTMNRAVPAADRAHHPQAARERARPPLPDRRRGRRGAARARRPAGRTPRTRRSQQPTRRRARAADLRQRAARRKHRRRSRDARRCWRARSGARKRDRRRATPRRWPGMLATRKRDYPEAARAYRAALDGFAEAKNELEHAKTALKFATMVLQQITEAEAAGARIDNARALRRGRHPHRCDAGLSRARDAQRARRGRTPPLRAAANADPDPLSTVRRETDAAAFGHAVGLVLVGLQRRRRRHLRRPGAGAGRRGRRLQRRVPVRRHRLRLHRARVHRARVDLSGRRRRPVLRHARPGRRLRVHRRLGGAARLHDRHHALRLVVRRLSRPAHAAARAHASIRGSTSSSRSA